MSKIRVVFDSAAKYEGVSLNDVLIKGPDLTNNLVGLLSRFRQGQVAAMADVEQMFFNFEIDPNYRDYLRFIWFKDNDVTKPLIDYRMKVHVFGNAPSPSIATYDLRKAVCNNEYPNHHCDEVCHFVRDNFYVDDALISRDGAHEVVDLISKTQDRLEQGGKIRLHKIVSNSSDILNSFPSTDLADGVSGIDFENESCFQRSLGMIWDIAKDEFTYGLNAEERPFTKRGLLSVINGVFDPLGFVAPVILKGRIVMREAIQNNSLAWDEPLPSDLNSEWQRWKQSLKEIENLRISRAFTGMSGCDRVDNCELHVFSDASKVAISAVAYLYDRCDSDVSNSQVGFVLGKSKIAPTHGHTIPRLELCAALLATDLAGFLQRQLSISPNRTFLYTDSQVILGYLHNESRRFYVYVSNNVDRILSVSKKDQWQYVSTDENPADQGTRPFEAKNLCESLWLKGPKQFLDSRTSSKVESDFEMVNPDNDKEVHPLFKSRKLMSVHPI